MRTKLLHRITEGVVGFSTIGGFFVLIHVISSYLKYFKIETIADSILIILYSSFFVSFLIYYFFVIRRTSKFENNYHFFFEVSSDKFLFYPNFKKTLLIYLESLGYTLIISLIIYFFTVWTSPYKSALEDRLPTESITYISLFVVSITIFYVKIERKYRLYLIIPNKNLKLDLPKISIEKDKNLYHLSVSYKGIQIKDENLITYLFDVNISQDALLRLKEYDKDGSINLEILE